MIKHIITLLFLFILFTNSFAQNKPFGHKVTGYGDIMSDAFFIKEGFILDSAASYGGIFRFEYDDNGRLERDINFIKFPVIDSVTGRFKSQSGFRDYFYNDRGDVDSVKTGVWYGPNSESDQGGYRAEYIYDDEGNILSKSYITNGAAYSIEEYNYDSFGNIVLTRIIIPETQDTTVDTKEYDSQNRLIKTIINNQPFSDVQQVVYEYDTTGNINFTIQNIKDDTLVSNEGYYYIEFDQFGKMDYQIQSRGFNPADSTWEIYNELICDYDEYGNILNMGEIVRYHYDNNGNLDTLTNTHAILSGYMGAKGKIVDSYGNNITFPEFYLMTNFYYSGFVTGVDGGKLNDLNYNLSQNYPNPFNPVTSITYSLPKSGMVTLKIYDMLGKEIAVLVNEEKQSGIYKATWNASDIASGVYFYKITSGEYSKTNKMLLLK
ncbi:MAG: T9SS type A sorting domain-containing protein [Ignavibacteriaceae bacterium]